MKMFLTALCTTAALAAAALAGGSGVPAPSGYFETLDATSTYTRGDCLGPCLCAAAPVSGPAAGTFTLVFNHADMWTRYYDVIDVNITASTSREVQFTYTGSGTYEIGGDFALTHRMVLNLVGSNADPTLIQMFDSGYKVITGPGQYNFPAIGLDLETPLMGCTKKWLRINTTFVPSCAADLGRQGGIFGPDGQRDNNDFIVFIDLFFAGDERADRGVQGGQPGQDGGFDNNDFVVFINDFFGPC